MSFEAMISRRHSRMHGWRVLFEVPFYTPEGTATRRQADAIAISRTEIHGFEIKSCRYDLEKEFACPEKSEPFRKLCNSWWLVCDRDIFKGRQAPEGWGVLCPDENDTLQVIVDAPHQERNAIPLDFAFNLIQRREFHIYGSRREDDEAQALYWASTNVNAQIHLEGMKDRSVEDKWRIAMGLIPLF